ncbi:hypothetical protein M0638_00755 [Roseomonas sp. NAR14]|uniref:Uncharacterized protein n=1 Tax=Roseomonas acroporae TaxID=2937791 RepID=A0A9X2BUC5_9PROT|nr:hypothetical protein [Roseomonas acroporae]MCK8782909.1 hypothetical protein [Roseomonas acroporae]
MPARLLGVFLVVVAAVIAWRGGGGLRLGRFLSATAPTGLAETQDWVTRHLGATAWDGVFVPLLGTPAWLAPLVLGLLFLLLAARR